MKIDRYVQKGNHSVQRWDGYEYNMYFKASPQDKCEIIMAPQIYQILLPVLKTSLFINVLNKISLKHKFIYFWTIIIQDLEQLIVTQLDNKFHYFLTWRFSKSWVLFKGKKREKNNHFNLTYQILWMQGSEYTFTVYLLSTLISSFRIPDKIPMHYSFPQCMLHVNSCQSWFNDPNSTTQKEQIM